jgi:Flp pilus assembly protein TadD
MNEQEQTLLNLMGYMFLQSARPDKAAVVLTALDAMAPGQPKVLRALALAQLRRGKPDRALGVLDRLAMSGSVDAVFHLLRAQSLTALARHDEAAAAMQNYVHLRKVAGRIAAPA